MDSNSTSERNNQVDYCDATTANTVENGTTKTIGWTKRIVEKNVEQERVIEKLKKVLNFLEKTEESLGYIDEPLDDILSNLKYLPVDTSFDDLPTEIKTNILEYLCDSGAFVAAAVCQEWKSILKGRLSSLDEINVGKCCSNKGRVQK